MRRGRISLSFVRLAAVGSVLLVHTCSASGVEHSEPVAPPNWTPIPEDGVIEKAGAYYLLQDINVDRNTGIEIKADHVTVDLGGHAVRFTGTPREGTYGIVANGQSGVSIANGVFGGFWFNIHCTQNERLRIRGLTFDDIPYLAVNVAQSKDVAIEDCSFVNFRYDVPKEGNSTYLVGINIGAEDVVIAHNRFLAKPDLAAGEKVEVETVFVLFSANISKNCVVVHNDLDANFVLPRSYGVWIATNSQATIAHNRVHNMKYGVCLGADASTLVFRNQFAADDQSAASPPVETFGVQAAGAKELVSVDNTFAGIKNPTVEPQRRPAEGAGG